MAIKCGHCLGEHATVADVQSCSTNPIPDRIDAAFALAGELMRAEASMGQSDADVASDRLAHGEAFLGLTPESAAPATRTLDGPPATAKQVIYLRSLLEQRECDAARKQDLVDRIEGYTLTKREASFAINTLLSSKRISALAPAASPGVKQTVKGQIEQDGIYRNPQTGEIFKVQWNRANGSGRHLYAKQATLVFGDRQFDAIPLNSDFNSKGGQVTFDYRPGLLNRIKPEWRMTFEEAKTFGALYGNCVRCGRDLTNEESVEKGIGPVCGKRSNWA